MHSELKIKLTIANRVYPLTIKEHQEASLRNSAKKIQGTIKKLEESYAVQDKQDVLAMCALQYAAELEIQLHNKIESEPLEKVNELINLIDLHLSTY
mgnify:CR=1 FL=1